ncbi:MAG: hypothetical protein IPJ30_08455 [Acidobacteria bacterium]|nr:hypothetical protein [Acidobacteriota bacterium]
MIRSIAAILLFAVSASACAEGRAQTNRYKWQIVTEKADYPKGYNYPVFVIGGKMLALNNGGWISEDAKTWKKTELPDIGLNSAYQKFVQFNGAVYALGTMTGNYLNFELTSRISRTRDGESWETVAETSNLPKRVFYGAAVFNGKIWMIGGWDGKKYHNDVWNSADGAKWTQVTADSGWSPRTPAVTVVFKDRLWMMGGGVIDGEKDSNPNSYKEVWTSGDGRAWTRIETNSDRKWRGNPVVFDGKLWLEGANRGGGFESAVWVSRDGRTWDELPAPWSPRGAVAVCVFDEKLFLTGGKSSYVENGDTKFVYSNDVWKMEKRGLDF